MHSSVQKLRQKGWNFQKPFRYFRNKIKRFMDTVEKYDGVGDDF